jgi:hypothetical protein
MAFDLVKPAAYINADTPTTGKTQERQVCLKPLDGRIRRSPQSYDPLTRYNRHLRWAHVCTASPAIEKRYCDRSIVVHSEVEVVATDRYILA